MRVFIKLVLLTAIVLFAFFNYRYISFDKGISKTSFEDKGVLETLQTVSGIQKVEYYKKPFAKESQPDKSSRAASSQDSGSASDEYIYKVYIVTNEDAYLLDATEDDIAAFSLMGVFSSKLQPVKVKPIPFYVEIIVGLVVLIIPFGRRSKKASN